MPIYNLLHIKQMKRPRDCNAAQLHHADPIQDFFWVLKMKHLLLPSIKSTLWRSR